VIFPISGSQVARFTSMSHQCLALISFGSFISYVGNTEIKFAFFEKKSPNLELFQLALRIIA
jgi:hypothetical protein